MKRTFLCLDCNHSANEGFFGEHVCCPDCASRNVVDADLWQRYCRKRKQSSAEAQPGDSSVGVT